MKQYEPEEFEELKKDTLRLFQKFDGICKSLDLNYWAMYGTLIGAVRHQGFIPWDDDFDVAMPRSDYEKLINFFITNGNKYQNLYIDNYKTNPKCFFYITRVCDTDHLLDFPKVDYKSGLFIDIYPFDGMGNDEDKAYWMNQVKLIDFLHRETYLSCAKGFFVGRNTRAKILNFPINVFSKIKGRMYFFNKMDNKSKKYSWNESKYIGCPIWAGWMRFLKKEWFDETVMLPFEDTKVPAPKSYDLVLKEIYGDYMTLPPEDQRKPSHDYEAFKMKTFG